MSKKHPRVTGTTEGAIARAEEELGRSFPPSFRSWLLENNVRGIEGITIYPVLDDRDVRTTWYSIVRRYREEGSKWLSHFKGEGKNFDHLMPFGDCGTGDFYCFDYGCATGQGEFAIVFWCHETGDTEFRAKNFAEFVVLANEGEFDED